MRHNNVQAVGRAALKDDHQPLVIGAGFSRVPCRSREERRDRRSADYGHRPALHKCPSGNGHSFTHFTYAEIPASPAAIRR